MINSDGMWYPRLKYALSKNIEDTISADCSPCRFPFLIWNEMITMTTNYTSSISDKIDDDVSIINDTPIKSRIYMDHVCRCRSLKDQIYKTWR